MANLLKEFNQDSSAFRYTRVVLGIETEKPSQKLVLVALAIRTNAKTGTCHPSYDMLCKDTGLSRSVVAAALVYLRDELSLVAWKQGHGNQYMEKNIANVYTLNYKKMKSLSEDNGSPASELSEESGSPIGEVLGPIEGGAEFDSRTLTTKDSNCSRIQLLTINQGPLSEGTTEIEIPGRRRNEVLNGGGSPATELSKKVDPYADALVYSGFRWVSRDDVGRPLSPPEVMEMKHRNALKLAPADIVMVQTA